MKNILIILILFLVLPQITLAIDSIDDLGEISHWTCDETSGVRYDSNTVNSNDLTDNNTVSYTTGLLNNACSFVSANSEWLSISDASQTGLEPASFSMSAWAKQISTKKVSVVGKYYTGSSGIYSYTMGFNADTTQKTYSGVTNGTNYDELTGSATLSTDTWYHLVFTYNGSTKELKSYVNGSASGSMTGIRVLANSTGDFGIGHAYSTDYFNGYIDEITFDNEVWDATTITALYNSGVPLPYTTTATTSTSTATTTTSFEDDNIVFSLGVIIFLLSLIFTGFIFNSIRKK